MASIRLVRVYLHIGANKTGTTGLQHKLASSTGKLRSEGFLYPVAGRGAAGDGSKSHCALASALGFDPVRKPVPDAERLTEALHAEIAASECPNVVLSSEFFMLRREIAPVAAFLERYDVRVVVFLRHHLAWLESLVRQAVLTVEDLPWDATVSGYLAHQDRVIGQYIDYHHLLADWSAHFDKENMIVRPYEQHDGAPEIVSSFFEGVGYADIGRKLGPAPILNASMPDDALDLIRQLRRAPLPSTVRKALVRAVEKGSRGTGSGAPMTSELRERIRARFEPQYARIAKEYMGRADGILFSSPEIRADTIVSEAPSGSAFRKAGYVFRGAARMAIDAASGGRETSC